MKDPRSANRREEMTTTRSEPRSSRKLRHVLVLSLVAGLVAQQTSIAETDLVSPGDIESAVVIDAFESGPRLAVAAAGIDEIVVTAERHGARAGGLSFPYADPLRERIRRELQQLDLLIDEYDWRQETVRINRQAPRIRWGYDPRDHLRVAALVPRVTLPLDLVQPATVFSVGF